MVLAARRRLGADPRFAFFSADIQRAPLPGGGFDRVTANHMLYHVPDIDRGVAEMARLLAPAGLAAAATNGAGSMRELHLLIREAVPDYRIPSGSLERFSLQNGPQFFERHFSGVRVERYEDSLWVTECAPLLDYIFSSTTIAEGLGEKERSLLETLFERRIARDGGIFIGKEAGVILARR